MRWVITIFVGLLAAPASILWQLLMGHDFSLAALQQPAWDLTFLLVQFLLLGGVVGKWFAFRSTRGDLLAHKQVNPDSTRNFYKLIQNNLRNYSLALPNPPPESDPEEYRENVSDALQDQLERMRNSITACLIVGLLGTVVLLAHKMGGLKQDSKSVEMLMNSLPEVFQVTAGGVICALLGTIFFLDWSIGHVETIENRLHGLNFGVEGKAEQQANSILKDAKDKVEANFEAMAAVLQKLLTAVEGTKEVFATMNDATGSMKQVAKDIKSTAQSIEKLPQQYESLFNKMQQGQDQFLGELRTVHTSTFSELHVVVKNLQEQSSQLGRAQGELLHEVRKLPEEFKQTVQQTNELFKSKMHDVGAQMTSQMGNLISDQKAGLERVNGSLHETVTQMKQRIGEIGSNVHQFSENVASINKNATHLFERLDNRTQLEAKFAAAASAIDQSAATLAGSSKQIAAMVENQERYARSLENAVHQQKEVVDALVTLTQEISS